MKVLTRKIIGLVVISAVLLPISCSKLGGGQSVESAAGEYLAALANGTFDGYLAHEKAYQQRELAAKQQVPSDMWAQRQVSMRGAAKAEIQRASGQNPYGGWNNQCYQAVRSGASVAVKEIRSVNPTQWQVFYEVSYPDQNVSPPVVMPGGKQRFLRAAQFSVGFEKLQEQNVPLGDSQCNAVDGTTVTWPVPPLGADEAMRLAQQSNAIPKNLTTNIRSNVAVSSGTNWNSWNEFLAAGDALKAVFVKHGWTVQGFEKPSLGWYVYGGQVTPPAAARQWVLDDRGSYKVVLLEKPEVIQSSFSAQEDTAVLSLSTKFSGCTPFCELWKDVRTMLPYIGFVIFHDQYGNYPTIDLDVVDRTQVNFFWTPPTGWQIARR